jgi:hypothetical protein
MIVGGGRRGAATTHLYRRGEREACKGTAVRLCPPMFRSPRLPAAIEPARDT